jgi:hypothetical protein
MKNRVLMVLCLSLLAVPQIALGQSPAAGKGDSEDDLSGTWLVIVHLTTTNGFSEMHDYKAVVTPNQERSSPRTRSSFVTL